MAILYFCSKRGEHMTGEECFNCFSAMTALFKGLNKMPESRPDCVKAHAARVGELVEAVK